MSAALAFEWNTATTLKLLGKCLIILISNCREMTLQCSTDVSANPWSHLSDGARSRLALRRGHFDLISFRSYDFANESTEYEANGSTDYEANGCTEYCADS